MAVSKDSLPSPNPSPRDDQSTLQSSQIYYGKYDTWMVRPLRLVFLTCIILVVVGGAFLVNETTLSFLRPDIGKREIIIDKISDNIRNLKRNLSDIDERANVESPAVRNKFLIWKRAFLSGGDNINFLDERSDFGNDNQSFQSLIQDYKEITKKINSAEKAISDYQNEIGVVRKDVINMFLMIRSFCLGALGGFSILMANYAFDDAHFSVISRERYGRSLASMLMGGIVAVLAFGLFYTKQISVFHQQEEALPTSVPDFWRMTILCVMAGAFADRIFRMAVGRADQLIGIIGTGGTRRSTPMLVNAPDSTQRVIPPPPRRNRRGSSAMHETDEHE